MAERGGGFDRPSDRLSGLWALILVARHHGIHATLDQLRRDNLVEGGSLDLGAIARCASGIGLAARVLPLRWDELRQAGKALPVILELRNGSFFLLAALQETPDCAVAHLVDCAGGGEIPLLLDRTELEKVWAGRALLLKRNYELGDEQQPFGMGLVASFIFRDRRTVVDVAVCAAMLSVLALAPIMFWRLMTDRVLQYHAFSTFWVLSVFMAVFIAFETAFSAARRSFLVTLTTKIDVKLSTYMFAKVLALPVDYFERVPTGYTLHQMGMIGRIRSFLLGQLFGTVLDGGILLIFVPVMVFFSPLLTAIVLGLCSAIVAVIVAALPALRRRGGDVEAAEAARSGMLAQTIQGMRTVKSLSLDRRQRHEWDVLTARVARARIAEGRLSNLVQSVVLPIERLVVSGSLAVGVYVALQSPDPATIGTLFAFLMLSQRIASPLVQAAQLLQQFDEARIATAVVADLVNRPPEEGRDGRGVRQPILGHVAFQDVLFSYRGAPRPALRGLSFEVPRGTSLGVMGRSGSGKTTITRLLQRLHSDYSGLIKIDGVDVRQYDVDFLRSSLGVVLQENFLFSGTIRDNIAMAKPDAGYDEVVTAARMAGAEEFIDKLPAGYETHVYEGSPNLSGGQRQRLAIARALITDPRILILDEATSALDAESEAVVNANIDRIARGRTVITISHRLASLVKCDAIMVLDGGAIDDIGRHEELLERNDIYAHLWFTQNQHAGGPGAGDGPGRARRAQPRLAYRGPG